MRLKIKPNLTYNENKYRRRKEFGQIPKNREQVLMVHP